MARAFITAVLLFAVVLIGENSAQPVETNVYEFSLDSASPPRLQRLPPIDELDRPEHDSNRVEELPPLVADEPETDPAISPTRRGSPAGFGGPFARNGAPVGFTTTFDPSVSLEDQVGTFTHWGEELRLAAPAWKSEQQMLLVTSSVGVDQFNTTAIFPTSGTDFPETLWNIRLGTFYIRPLECGWKFGAGINVGSASDVPFGAIRDVNPAVFTFLNIPRPGDNAWNFALFYSPLSEIPFPIPGVSYQWHASDELQMNIGLPAQVVYQPTESLLFTASYMLLTTLNLRGTWYINDNWSAYAAYESRNRSWFPHDRVNDDERLFSYEQALLVGIQRPVWKRLKADVSAGYLFDRFFFLGEKFEDRHNDRIDVAAGATISAQLGVAF